MTRGPLKVPLRVRLKLEHRKGRSYASFPLFSGFGCGGNVEVLLFPEQKSTVRRAKIPFYSLRPLCYQCSNLQASIFELFVICNARLKEKEFRDLLHVSSGFI